MSCFDVIVEEASCVVPYFKQLAAAADRKKQVKVGDRKVGAINTEPRNFPHSSCSSPNVKD